MTRLKFLVWGGHPSIHRAGSDTVTWGSFFVQNFFGAAGAFLGVQILHGGGGRGGPGKKNFLIKS